MGQDGDLDAGPAGPTLELAWRLAVDFADTARVAIDENSLGVIVSVVPRNPRALSFGWLDFRGGIILWAGDFGCRWELDGSAESVVLAENLARAMIAGRVRETVAPGRSMVEVLLTDGSVERDIVGVAPVGCLPLPFWPRWARTVQYEPSARVRPGWGTASALRLRCPSGTCRDRRR